LRQTGYSAYISIVTASSRTHQHASHRRIAIKYQASTQYSQIDPYIKQTHIHRYISASASASSHRHRSIARSGQSINTASRTGIAIVIYITSASHQTRHAHKYRRQHQHQQTDRDSQQERQPVTDRKRTDRQTYAQYIGISIAHQHRVSRQKSDRSIGMTESIATASHQVSASSPHHAPTRQDREYKHRDGQTDRQTQQQHASSIAITDKYRQRSHFNRAFITTDSIDQTESDATRQQQTDITADRQTDRQQ
jgi:hypothetical protein